MVDKTEILVLFSLYVNNADELITEHRDRIDGKPITKSIADVISS